MSRMSRLAKSVRRGRAWTGFASVVALAALVWPLPAHAQFYNQVHVGLATGPSVATGAFGDRVKTGYDLGGYVSYRLPQSPFGLRADIMYNGFDASDALKSRFAVDAGYASVTAGTLDLTMELPHVGPVRPYLIGGGGVYSRQTTLGNFEVGAVGFCDYVWGYCSGESSGLTNGRSRTKTQLGLNGGGGVRLPLGAASVFLETQYNTAFTTPNATGIVPIVIGVQW